MIYAAICATLGWHTFCDATPKGEKLLALIGIVLYVGGMICGEIIESRLKKRIEKLESKVNTNETVD